MEIIMEEYGEALLAILAGFAVVVMFAGLFTYVTSI